MSERRKRYTESLRRFAGWLAAQRDPDGTFRGENITAITYMALPLYGQAIGREDQALQACDILESRYIRGDTLEQPDRLQAMLPYALGWVAMEAAQCGRNSLQSALRKSLLSFQDPRTGGFFGSAEARDAGAGLIDFDSTTQACAALCAMGERAAASRCGEFLRGLVQAQPDSATRFFLQWDSPRGLIREFDPKSAAAHVLVYAEPQQRLYKTGLLARAFALLAGTTGEAGYLGLAESAYRQAADRSPDVWTCSLAHKMGWAAWTLLGLTQKRGYAEDAARMADHLLTLQQPDGGFHYRELWPSYAEVPVGTKTGGAQFATWIAYGLAGLNSTQ